MVFYFNTYHQFLQCLALPERSIVRVFSRKHARRHVMHSTLAIWPPCQERIMTTLASTQSVLSDDLLERCAQRAAIYDRENRFFSEDFEELRQAGYLLISVPQEFGGLGLSLAEICQ